MGDSRTWEFDGWVLDSASGDLRRDGALTRLQEQPLRILMALLERPGEVITREELISRLWPQGVVEFDMGLNTAVRKLRMALEDDADTPRYIETIPRRGYRFVGQLSGDASRSGRTAPAIEAARVPGSSRQPQGRRAWWWTLACAVVLALLATVAILNQVRTDAAVAAGSLAVLPFGPLTEAPDDAVLGLGVTGALITRLSTIAQLRVTPLGSVRRYQPHADPLLIGRELRVDTVLEGHLQQQDNRLRVSARLLRVADGVSLWSGQFDEVIEDLFVVQDAIAERVAAAIAPQINGEVRFENWPAETASLEAFRQFAAAQFHQFRRDTNGVPAAIAHYEAALAADPRYADAWAGLSVALMVEAVFGMQPVGPASARAREAAQRAMESNPQSPAALGAMGHVLIQADRRYAEGLEFYRRSLARNPDQAIVHQWVAIAQAHLGNMDLALDHIRRAQALEPRTLPIASNAGMLLYFARRHDEAINELESLLRLEPRVDQALSALGNARLARSDVEGALAAFRARALPGPGGLGDLGRAYAAAGDRVAAAAELERLRVLAGQGYGVAHDEATIHALLGNRQDACGALERALGDGSQMLGFLRVDPRLDAIRGEPCYARVEAALYSTAP